MNKIELMSVKEILTELKQKLINHFIDCKLTKDKDIEFVGRVGSLVDEIEKRIDYLWGKKK